MKAGTLETTMRRLGLVFILALFFQVRIDDRSVLMPLFTVAGLVLLHQLGRYRAMASSRWFLATQGCAVVTLVASAVALIPWIEAGAPSAVAQLGIDAGAAAYAGVLADWARLQRWEPPLAKALDAGRWLIANVVATVVAVVAFLVLVDPDAPGDSGYSPDVLFGRPIDGWAPIVVILVLGVISLVGLLKLRKASVLIRHSLRSQPDAELVAV